MEFELILLVLVSLVSAFVMFVSGRSVIKRRLFRRRLAKMDFSRNPEYVWGKKLKDLEKITLDTRKAATEQLNFLSAISHEIRTPMNAIIGMSRSILDEGIEGRNQKLVEYMHISAVTLLGVINDILDFSKIDSGKYTLAPVDFDFPRLMEDIGRVGSALAFERHVEFIVEVKDPPVCLYGDEIKLQRVLLGLSARLIRRTTHGVIRLLVDFSESEMFFRFINSEEGVNSSYYQIYESVNELDENAFSSNALGILISKKLCGMLMCKISCEPDADYGDILCLQMPCQLGDEANLNRGDRLSFKAPEVKLLAVDDYQTNLNVIEALLSTYEITCDKALSGGEALRLVTENEYELVLMDHMMEDMDGLETTRRIRAMGGKYEKLPIIAVTAHTLSGNENIYAEAGFNDCMSKPLRRETFEGMLKKWLPAEKLIVTAFVEMSIGEYSDTIKKIDRISGMDVKDGLERVNGMQEAYERSLRIFANGIPERLDKLTSNLSQGRLDAFAIDIHGIKGSLGNIGEVSRYGLAAKLELAAKGGDLEFCKESFPGLRESVKDLSNSILDCFPTNTEETREKGDDNLLQNSLADVILNLEAFNKSKSLKALKEIMQYKFDSNTEENLRNLCDAIEGYDFDLGLDIARGMIV